MNDLGEGRPFDQLHGVVMHALPDPTEQIFNECGRSCNPAAACDSTRKRANCRADRSQRRREGPWPRRDARGILRRLSYTTPIPPRPIDRTMRKRRAWGRRNRHLAFSLEPPNEPANSSTRCKPLRQFRKRSPIAGCRLIHSSGSTGLPDPDFAQVVSQNTGELVIPAGRKALRASSRPRS